MGGCLRFFDGRTYREATEAEAEAVKVLIRTEAGLMGNVLCRIIDEARTCTFEQLERLVANLHPNNKKLLRKITLKTELRLWNPKERCAFRYWA